MKPKSIISLIIAAALVLAGIITCVVATVMSKGDGIMLFPEADKNGNLVYSMDLDGVSKITVNVLDADVTVIGGAEKSTIEVVNFNANYYKLNESGGSLNFAQVEDFMSMFKFWENGFSFKGMRYILRFGDDAPGGKKVIIRLTDEDHIRLVNLVTDTGTVSLENCAFAADYTLKAENGKAELRNVTGCQSLSIYGTSAEITADKVSTDKLNVNGNTLNTTLTDITAKEGIIKTTDGNVSLENSTIDSLQLNTVSGNVSVSPYNCTEGSVTTESGKVTLDFADTDTFAVNAATMNGKINVNGQFTDSFTKSPVDAKYSVSVTTSGGDIYITHP